MRIIYERKINYYETDKMGVVHHSNYIRFLEEARTYWMNELGIPFEELEENGLTIPVLAVNCEYKHHITFGDTITIEISIKEFNGVRMTVGYDIRNKKTGEVSILAETKHCFTDINLKPINLKKRMPRYFNVFEEQLEKKN